MFLLNVLKDFLQALDCKKKYCAALFIDLLKAPDTVDLILLIKSFPKTDMSNRSECLNDLISPL